jgi:hypothetical protein
LRDHVLPTLGPRPVREIDIELVLAVLAPVWSSKPETAIRLRSRIELIRGSPPGRLNLPF